jgi:hypothetical protein
MRNFSVVMTGECGAPSNLDPNDFGTVEPNREFDDYWVARVRGR